MFARRVAAATLVQVVGKALALGFSLVSVKLLTSYLGEDGYGAYAIVLTGAGLAFAAADLGVPMLLARELAKEPERADALGAVLLFVRLVACVLVLAIVAAFLPALPYTAEVKQGLVLGAAGLLLGVVAMFPLPFFQVHLRLGLSALVEVATRGVAFVALVLVVVLDLGFLPAVATIGISWAFGLVLAFALSRPFWRIGVRADLREAARILRSALPIALVLVLGVVHFRVDALLLSFLKPAADVGVYTLAYLVFEQALVVQALFMVAVFPILTRFVHAQDEEASRDVIDKSLRFLVVLGLAVSSLLFTLAEPIVRALATTEFADSATVLRILAFGLVPLYASAIFGSLLISLATLRLVALASVVGIALNVGLNLALIPRWSYDAAAATTLVSEVVGLGMVYAIAHRRGEARVRTGVAFRLLLAVVAVVGIALASLLIPWWGAAPLVVGAVVALAVALRLVTPAEIRSVVSGG